MKEKLTKKLELNKEKLNILTERYANLGLEIKRLENKIQNQEIALSQIKETKTEE